MLTLVLFFSGCGNDNFGTTNVGNPDISSVSNITIGQLTTEGKAQLTFPLAIFGSSSDDLVGASVTIKRNNVTVVNALDPSSYYQENIQAVSFYLTSLNNGDVLTFLVSLNTGVTKSFQGTVSDAEESYATLLSGPLDLNLTIWSYENGDNQVVMDATIFGDTHDEANITVNFIYPDDTREEYTINARDYYDASEDAVVFSPNDLWGQDFGCDYHGPGTGEKFRFMNFVIVRDDGSTASAVTDCIDYETNDTSDDYDSMRNYSFSTQALTGTSTQTEEITYHIETRTMRFGDDCAADSFVDADGISFEQLLSLAGVDGTTLTDEEINALLDEEHVFTSDSDYMIDNDSGFIELRYYIDADNITITGDYGIMNSDGSYYMAAQHVSTTHDVSMYITTEGTVSETQVTENGTMFFYYEGDSCTITSEAVGERF